MLVTLFVLLVVGGLAGWLIGVTWGFNLKRIVSVVTLAGVIFAILVYLVQSVK